MVFYISLVILLVSFAFHFSYAYMTATVLGNDTATPTAINAGTLTVDFATSAYIDNTNLLLINDSDEATKAEKTTFTVKNSGNITAKYTLDLTELTISDNFKSTYFKWDLLKNGTSINTGNFTTAVTGTDFTITPSNQTITVGTTDTYELRIWLSESGTDQLSLTNGTFNAKVRMTAVS